MSNEILGRLALIGSMMLAAGLAVVGPLAGQEAQVISGDRVAVYNLAGQVEIVPGTGSEVVVEVMRGGDDGDRLEIEVGEVRGREALRIIYPGDQVIYPDMGRGSNTSLRVRDDGTFWNGSRSGDRVRISGRGSGLEAHADLRISVPAGVDLAVYLAAGEGRANDLETDLTFETGSGSVVVSEVLGNVNVDTGSGSIEINGVEGDVSADTGSGSIEVLNVVGDRFLADTGSGRVEASNVTVADLSVDTGSGRILLEGVRANEIQCDTGSGSVTLELLSDAENIDVDTGSGAVTLLVPEDFGAEVELDSGSGGVDVDVPTTIIEAKRDYFRGTIGDGVGRVVVDTGSGGIDIRGR
ncbi:MAG: DUF4097 family beta strand repeat-containing protein [Longimicrobiales bacterium]